MIAAPIDFGQLAASGLVFSVIVFAIATAMLLLGRATVDRPVYLKILTSLVVNGFAGLVAAPLMHPHWEVLVPLILGLAFSFAAVVVLRGFSFTGSLLMAGYTQLSLNGLLWGLWLITTADVVPFTRGLMLVGWALSALTLFVGLVQSFEQLEVVCRRHWRRPRVPTTTSPRSHLPKVSLHVPTYSEPPELVMATLNSLAELEYPNYEVLVIDNNTRDPALWQPVETHCQRLGERFRFMHVDNLTGAKAGALNFALRNTAPDVELIGVIDSDYKVNPNFLASLVGYFDDPKMGFVQTPQAYRDWEGHSYLRMCNWEYRLVFATTLVSRNERMAAITVGTMGLIRRKVLEEVGGWAEWCVTEDSELAVRIHAQGYKSAYLNTVFGKGLIPETFNDYKKQRFRWTYGPVQELRRHFRLFLPKAFAKPSALTAAQKIHHLIHGLGALKSGLKFLMLPLSAAIIVSMLSHGESIQIPPYAWPSFTIVAIAAFALKWHTFRTSMGCSFKDMLGALLAGVALDYTIRMASLWGLLTHSTLWRRTNKFRALPLGLGVLGSAMPEFLLGSAMWGCSIEIIRSHHTTGLSGLLLSGGLVLGAQYMIAPFLAILAEHGIRQRAGMDEQPAGLSGRIASPVCIDQDIGSLQVDQTAEH